MSDAFSRVTAEVQRRAGDPEAGFSASADNFGEKPELTLRFAPRLTGEFVVMGVGLGGAVLRAYRDENAFQTGHPQPLRETVSLDLYRGLILESKVCASPAEIVDHLLGRAETLGVKAEEHAPWV